MLDNIGQAHRFEGDALCAALTQEVLQGRILGVSRVLEVPTNVLILGTGNGVVVAGDLTRRVLKCDLDPKCERPEDRMFARDFRQFCRENRPTLVTAALTILRAHHEAGRPDCGLTPLGSFEQWSSWVRASLVWLGMPDPCLALRDFDGDDPVKLKLAELLWAWNETFGRGGATVADAVARLGMQGVPRLEAAINDIALDKGRLNARLLGNFIRRHEKRVVDGLRFERQGTRQNAVVWCAVAMS